MLTERIYPPDSMEIPHSLCQVCLSREVLHVLLPSIQGYHQPGWFLTSSSLEFLGHSGAVNINPDPYEEMAVVKNSRETPSLY